MQSVVGRSPDLAPSIRPASSVVEHIIGNDEVGSSILPLGTTTRKTTERGTMSEVLVAAKIDPPRRRHVTPAFGHDHPFDMIAHWDGHLSRIQVKTARDLEGGAIAIPAKGSSIGRGASNTRLSRSTIAT